MEKFSVVASELPYILAAGPSKYLSMVSVKVRENLWYFTRNEENGTNIGKLLCQLGTMALERKAFLNISVVTDILSIFKKMKIMGTNLDMPVLSEFLYSVYQQNKADEIYLSSEDQKFILTVCPAAVEAEVVRLLKCCWEVNNVSDLHVIKSALKTSVLVEICCQSSDVFRHLFSILSYSWFYSEGHPAVGYLISEFFATAENYSTQNSLEFSLPEVFPVAFPFSVPSLKDFNSSLRHAYVNQCWHLTLQALKSNICQKSDIILALVIFPQWYKKLLISVYKEKNNDASELLSLLWQFKDKHFKVKNLVQNPWLNLQNS